MPSDQSTKTDSLSEFIAIHVATLRGDLKIPFNAYVRVAGKNILYCRQGDSFEGQRLERLKSKKLDKMYIRYDDDMAYRQYLESSIDQAYDTKSGKPLDIRTEVIQGFNQAATEQYFENPNSENFYGHVRSSAQRFTEFMQREPDAINFVLKLKNPEQNIAHHGFNVASLTLSMLKENSPNDIKHFPLVALGCFLHDIDHFRSGYKFSGPIEQMTEEQRQSYLQHPARGAQDLHGKSFVDPIVFKIISQHEENAQGTGFPRGINSNQIDPLVLYAATANAFDRLVCFEKINAKDALKKLYLEKLGLYPFEYLQLMQSILKKAQML